MTPQRSTLVVDDDEARRRHLVHALSRRGLRYLDVADAFGAMAALGRADFGAVVATEGRRTLSLRGLCQLARRRHPDVVILVIHREGSDPAAIPGILGTPVDVIEPHRTPDEVAAAVEAALLTPPDAEDVSLSEFNLIPETNSDKTMPNARPVGITPPSSPATMAVSPSLLSAAAVQSGLQQAAGATIPDEDPTVKMPIATLVPAIAPDSLSPDEPTERLERVNLQQAAAQAQAQVAAELAAKERAALANVSTAVMPNPVLAGATPTSVSNTAVGFAPPDGVGAAVPKPISSLPAEPTAAAPTAAEPMALLEGALERATGPALLLGIFSQELTGRLVVKDGAAAGTLYFYKGEPVWADDPLGDAGLHRKLVQKSKLPPDARIAAVAEGQLLGSLVQAGVLSGQAMHDFMRELVRDVVLLLSNAQSGSYRFEEDRKFLDVAPLLRVNPFGLVLESRRKTVSPAQLIAMSGDMEHKFVIPGPGLAKSADKLAPFVRGARLDHIIDGTKTVRQVLEYTSLDQFMGTLVMLSLADTKLVTLESEPHSQDAGGVTLNDLPEIDDDAVTIVDAQLPAPESEEEARAREAIFGLYMRLKPLTVPRQVLGVGVDADVDEIEAAYAARMRELDPARVPEGSAQQLLTARIDELRKKVTSAYQALKLQTSSNTTPGFNPELEAAKKNPF